MSHIIHFVFLNRWKQKIFIVSLAAIAGMSGLFTPYYQRHFLNSLEARDLIVSGLLMLISFVAYQMTVYFSQKEALVAQKTLSDMLYNHILDLSSFSKLNKTTGELVSLYTTDIPSATMWLEQTLPYILTTFLPLIFAPIFLKLSFRVPLLYSLAVIVILMFFNIMMARRQSVYFYNFKRLAAERMTLVNEWIQSLKNLRTLGWIRPFEKNIFIKRKLETDNRVAMVTNGQIMNSFSSNMTYWLNLLVIVYFLSAATSKLHKEDVLVLIWVVGVFLSRPLRQLPWLLTMFFDALTSVRRLGQILSLQNLIPQFPILSSEQMSLIPKDVVLRTQNLNLVLNHDGQHSSLLKSIDLELHAGEVVALIGPVGSGKSLLLKCLIKDAPFTADSFFSKAAAYLPQDPFIFNSKIHNNLSFSYNDEYNIESSMDALRLAHFETAQFTKTLHTHDKDLREHTMLETVIGERGVNISGGQKQRLNLARLFYKPKPLFLLDDPFSAVDINTEYAITKSILELKLRGHTFLITTQRHTFLKHADRILYLDHGKIVFNGTYTDFQASKHHE